MKELFQLKITLKDSEPEIWRRIVVPQDITFYHLHVTLQIAMGWENCHLFSFRHNNTRIEMTEGDVPSPFRKVKVFNAEKEKLRNLLKVKSEFLYFYDFGDDWTHIIQIEKEIPHDPNLSYPLCIEGGMACPPEDCGGIFGYYELVNALKDKNHPDHEDMVDWIGSEFNPNAFDLNAVNKQFKRLKFTS